MDLDLSIKSLICELELAAALIRKASSEFGQIIADKSISLETRWKLYEKCGCQLSEKLSDITELKSRIDFTPYLPSSNDNLGCALYNELDIQMHETVSLEQLFEELIETNLFEEDKSLTDSLKEAILASNVYSFVLDW